jgi:hypothetical protein
MRHPGFVVEKEKYRYIYQMFLRAEKVIHKSSG